VSGKKQHRLLPFSSSAGSDFVSRSFIFLNAHTLVKDLHVNIQLSPAGKYIPRDRLTHTHTLSLSLSLSHTHTHIQLFEGRFADDLSQVERRLSS